MSLLLAHGHAGARQYPLGMVFVECEYVVSRINREEANRAVLLNLAVSALLSKKAQKAFAKQVKALTDGV